jgi:predicted HicB family RNase H-like nuclease
MTERRSKQLNIPMTPSDHKLLRLLAADAEISMAQYVLNLLMPVIREKSKQLEKLETKAKS